MHYERYVRIALNKLAQTDLLSTQPVDESTAAKFARLPHVARYPLAIFFLV